MRHTLCHGTGVCLLVLTGANFKRGAAACMQEPRPPQRASLRLQGIASDGTSVAEELRNGQVILKGQQQGTAGQANSHPEENKPRAMPTGAFLY